MNGSTRLGDIIMFTETRLSDDTGQNDVTSFSDDTGQNDITSFSDDTKHNDVTRLSDVTILSEC